MKTHTLPLWAICSCNDQVLAEDTDQDQLLEYVDISSVSQERGIERTESFRFGDAPSRARRIVQEGDVLVSTVRTYLKAIAKVDALHAHCIASTGFAVLRAKNDLVDKDFLAWLLKSNEVLNCIIINSKGVSYPAITSSDLMDIRVKIPISLSEQKVISDFLNRKISHLEEIISKLNNSLTQLANYRQSLITRAVTKGLDPNVEMKDSGVEWIGKIPKHWQVCKIKHIGDSFNGLTYSPKDLLSEGIPVLRSCNVQNAKIDLSDTVFVSEDQARDAMLEIGDVLICSRNGSAKLIGKCAYISQSQKYAFGAFMMVFRSTLKKFGYYILNSALFRYYKPLFSTTTINQLTSGTFGEFLIPLPPEKERLEISDALDRDLKKIDSLSEQVDQTISKLKEYRSSLISAAVTGQLAIEDEEASA